ncbi:Acetylornithine deacetylase/Succinyl-diaminopimelate desuccinylase [Monaibacterium marinum]|uniref:Acetylornithine deacetylase/Succinyl-diaminopimelate desuccinylase n=2 Tax=Pontivivens marinum TaxID=1690039 RepID=A0A2C9CT26_9RHOB|nr:Acetylornithine deacetylase/Succinyl-diaminopimelate desuccinylase [Monaibacterium marinum]
MEKCTNFDRNVTVYEQTQMSNLESVLSAADANTDTALQRLFALLRMPSISTDPTYHDDCVATADWLVAELNGLGFDATRRDTPGKPMVVAHGGPKDAPHVLFYGHYDVQPADPLELWKSDPFDPQIEEGPDGPMIRARGASDDKGQLMTFVEACRAWVETTGDLPVRITILFEGEEESHSPSLVPFLQENAEELKTEIALICDTGMWDGNTPSICTMLRGMVAEEIVIRAANRDLHSGGYGGPAANPIRILSHILASLHDEQGRVTLDGFYNGVHDVPGNLAQQWESLGFDPKDFLGKVGLSTPAGEQGIPALHQIWARPTCEFNGITGGYTGDGFKTVLPAEARAKISCRLVWDQDPHAIRDAIRARVRHMLPDDCEVEFIGHGADKATVMATSDPAFEKARKALATEWPNEAVYTGGGGSIPIAGHFKEVLGLDSMLIGFARDDDAIHSPNEKYNVKSFTGGVRSWVRVMAALGK